MSSSARSSSCSSTSAATLLNIVKSYDASDVLEFTAKRKAANDIRDGILPKDGDDDEDDDDDDDEKKEQTSSPSSVIVVDSKMTPLEAATLLWENNM